MSADLRIQAAGTTQLVAATTAYDCLAQKKVPTSAVELLAAGTLVYTDMQGATVTITGFTAGIKPIRARAISASTTVAVVLYFSELQDSAV